MMSGGTAGDRGRLATYALSGELALATHCRAFCSISRCDGTRPCTLSFDAEFGQLVLHMPRDAMVRRIDRTMELTARCVCNGKAARRIGGAVRPPCRFGRFPMSAASRFADIWLASGRIDNLISL